MKQNGRTINSYFIFIILLVMVIVGLNLLSNREEDYTRAEFIADLDAGNVSEIVIQPNGEAPTGYLEIQMKNGLNHKLYATDITELETLVREYGFDPVVNDIERENWFLTYMLPMLAVLAVGVFLFMMMNAQQAGGGNGKMMNFGKSRAKMSMGDKSVTFAQVAGLKEEKEELEEIVDFLKEPGKYTGVGARIPKGVLLEGPPGTGKTLLAKAVAGEAGVPFFSISGSDFVEMFVGVGASRVRDLFEEAKHNAPCIVFIDEIDAVARRRGTGMGGGHDEREQTLNQLLVEMDGFGVNEGIIVMAATNRVDILDPAILRPGRFDRKVAVGTPDVGGREEILKVHAKNKPLGDDVNLQQLAQTTAGFTGADLENLLNEAAIIAAKENRSFIANKDVKRAFVKVGIGAEKKSRIISDKEKKITAYHEAGHAILFHVLPDVGPVYSVSIIPTGGAGGYTMPLPEKDKELVQFYLECFDRPAFQDDIYQEGRMEDFDKAIEDTLIALNTGVLRTRDGSILKQADGKSSIQNSLWREKLYTITDMLTAIRRRLKIAKKEKAYSTYGTGEDVAYCFYDRELAEWLNSTREEILKILSSICKEAGLRELHFRKHRYRW